MRIQDNGLVGIGTSSPTALLTLGASNTARASLNLLSGTAPDTPNTGDIYANGTSIYYRTGSGSWADLTSAGSGMSNPMSTAGDIIFGSTSGTPTRLAGAGTDNWVLKYDTDTSAPYWGAESGSLAIGNTVSSGTEGAILFLGPGGALAQDSPNFFWNDSLNLLGLGTSAPDKALHVSGQGYITSGLFLGSTASGNYLSIGSTGSTSTVMYIGNGAIVTGTGATNAVAYWNGTNTLASETYLSISRGGTGIGTTPTQGQLLIGKTDGTYNLATLTDGTGISITEGNGTITISASGLTSGTACPTGWRAPSDLSPELSILAVETNVFPLYEVENGRRYTLNHEPRGLPVEEYLLKQGRFKHLNKEQIRQIQMDVDEEWKKLKHRAGFQLR